MKAELQEKIKNRKCIPAFKGVKFVRAIVKNGKTITVHQHINSETLTDEKAIELLKSGALTKEDFKSLPEIEEDKKAGRPKKEDK